MPQKKSNIDLNRACRKRGRIILLHVGRKLTLILRGLRSVVEDGLRFAIREGGHTVGAGVSNHLSGDPYPVL
jgi:translation elongation factor EF-Tu-like GTPase